MNEVARNGTHKPRTTSRTEVLLLKVRSNLKPGLAHPIQEELAAWLDILADLSDDTDATLLATAEIIVDTLLSDTPNVLLAKSSRENIQSRLRRHRYLTTFLCRGSPPTRVIIGLGTFLYIAVPLAILLFRKQLPTGMDFHGLDVWMLIFVAIAGGLGSVVSIMVRIKDFSSLSKTGPAILFFTGFFKPVIGMSFALFVFAALHAGLIPLAIDTANDGEKALYLFLALAFVAGFSERFAPDIVTTTETSTMHTITTKLSQSHRRRRPDESREQRTAHRKEKG